MKRDLGAVAAGLSMRWSSGQVEGHVTRTKLVERMGCDRANLDLHSRRIRHNPWLHPRVNERLR
ncbi:hypothetical protein [Streptomyces sp. NPDC005374]|uniref:hypothetical protein n=1 Tax=Streptomyces sp. NPDC005374 TaxID=3364713 RepID=UPI0036CDB59F